MRRNKETLSKSILLGVFISLMLLPFLETPVKALNADRPIDPYWYAGAGWDSTINWQNKTHGVEAKIQCNPGWVYLGHVNGYVTIEFPPTDTGRWFIEIGWIKDAMFLGAIKWYIAWMENGEFYRWDRDIIEYGSWHYYRIARDYPYLEWYVYFDDEPTHMYMFHFSGGRIRLFGEAAGPSPWNELDSYFKWVKYYYNDSWMYWDDYYIAAEDPPYHLDVINSHEFRAYGPA